ncbi:caspase family protein [Nostoc sp. UIC 10607]|uniref:nSTAND1 domain-containing NTPase n=1 Tax=Nostoc sp. UIC 10607 TaxID=3045935 RepID=UPI0039A10A6D
MSDFSRNLAFIIGINNYTNGISSLQNAVNDAKRLVEILREKHKYEVWVCLDEVATLKSLNQLLEKTLPEQVNENDRLLFYFAGHGIALNGNDGPAGYLIPQDAKLNVTETYLPMTKLQESLEKLPCRHFLGILDCCFAGAFRWSSTRDLLTAPEVIHQERYDRFITDSAWQVITSAAYDQKALDAFFLNSDRGQIGNHSPFAAALIEALAGKADTYPSSINGQPPGDGVITATELYLYLRNRVELATQRNHQRQTPGIWPLKKHDKGEYIFLAPGHPLNLPPAPPLDAAKNPYRGLESYDEVHSELFFGRTELVKKLYNFVKAHPLTVVLGASGSGKSSLVKAGLIPELRKDNADEWCILPPVRPGELPLPALNNALKNAQLPEVELQQPQQNLAMGIEVWVKSHPNSKLLLFIDQSEEIITLCQNEDERKQFFQEILTAINFHRHRLRVVLSLRSDFEPQIRDAGLKFVPAALRLGNTVLENIWQSGRFIVPAMTRGELRSAIEKPAETRVMYFQPHDLVEQLIDEVADMPGALPLLSFALSELYLKYLKRQRDAENRGITIDRGLIQSDYQDLGGVVRSLTQRADEEYEVLVQENPAYAQIIPQVMLRMVALGGGELARRQVPLSELEYPPSKNALVKEVIERFTKARLLVTGDDAEGNSYVEPAHDALVRGWQKLLGWRKQEEENLALQRRLTPAAQEWFTKKQTRFLWNADPRLDLLEKVLKSENNWFNQLEAEFVQRSVQKKNQNSIVRWSITGSVLVGSMIFSAAVWSQWRTSEINQANSLGRYSQSLFDQHNELQAFIEAIKAGKILQKQHATDPEVMTAFQKVVYEGSERNRLEGHDAPVYSVSFSPDGKTLASSSHDFTIKLWNLETGKLIRTLKGHNGEVNSAIFSPDGKTLASSSFDTTIKLWDLKTGKAILTLPRNDSAVVKSMSFSPDSKTLASSSDDNIITVWNLETGKATLALKSQDNVFESNSSTHSQLTSVNSVSFSPDGKTLTSTSYDGKIIIWNLEARKQIQVFRVDNGPIYNASFSLDGKTLAFASDDNKIKLWNLKTGKEIRTLQGHDDEVNSINFRHDGEVNSISFSPDGKTLVSAGDDNKIKLWNLKTGEEIRTFQAHNGRVYSVRFSPDGKTLASASSNTIKLWNLVNAGEAIRTFKAHNGQVYSVRFSPDGKTLASVSGDNTIKLWNLVNAGEAIRTFKGHNEDVKSISFDFYGIVKSISFSPNGKTLAFASSDNPIKLWNLETGNVIRTLEGYNVSFSPDGKTLAFASDATIKLWNLEIGKEIRTLQGLNGVNSVSFSPDGKTLASASDDSKIKVWNLETGITLTRVEDVKSISFNPDGKTLTFASSDNKIKVWNPKTDKTTTLWNVETSGDTPIINDHGGDEKFNFRSASFSTDGKAFVFVSLDNKISLWNLETGNATRTLKSHNKGSLVTSVSLSPDRKTLASASRDGTIELWDIDLSLDSLIGRSCNWVRNYLQNNPNVTDSDRRLCDDVPKDHSF